MKLLMEELGIKLDCTMDKLISWDPKEEQNKNFSQNGNGMINGTNLKFGAVVASAIFCFVVVAKTLFY